MSAHPYSEDTLIEKPAIDLLAGLGWQTINAFDEVLGQGGTLGREHTGEVVLTRHLVPALKKLNPNAPPEAIEAAVNELTRDRSVMSLAAANREVYGLLKNGVKVELRTPDGDMMPERIQVIDWDKPENNHFLLVSQLWVTGEIYKRRTDLVGFVNGLPLLVCEFKAVTERVEAAFKDNIRDYRTTIPALFWFNAFILVSNGLEGRLGSLTAEWEHYCDWKKISSEAEPGSVSLETILKGTCDKSRMLDLVENFTVFEEKAGAIRKVVAKNHQYLGVNNAISALLATLTPALSQGERGEGGKSGEEGKRGKQGEEAKEGKEGKGPQSRGGFQFSGLVERARELRRKQTPAEAILWELLRNRQVLGMKFRRQHQVGDYLTDFYCREAKLVVETDGTVHNTTAAQKKDQKRDAYLRSLGLEVLRFSNDLVLDHPDEVLAAIAPHLPSPSPSGRRVAEGRGEGKTHTRLGVFWQTQGSGKTYSMVFFSQKVLRKIPGNWTFVGVTDRNELDDQLYKNFASVGAVTEAEDRVRANSAGHLKQLLTEDHRYVFTLIQKFRTEPGQRFPKLSPRVDITLKGGHQTFQTRQNVNCWRLTCRA